MLQRGRLPKEAEGRELPTNVSRASRASTGPPPEGGGRRVRPVPFLRGIVGLQRGRLPKEAEGIERMALEHEEAMGASTGPPPEGGGRLLFTIGQHVASLVLQRGRLPKEAEGAVPVGHRLKSKQASTGPPPEGGGREVKRGQDLRRAV